MRERERERERERKREREREKERKRERERERERDRDRERQRVCEREGIYDAVGYDCIIDSIRCCASRKGDTQYAIRSATCSIR